MSFIRPEIGVSGLEISTHLDRLKGLIHQYVCPLKPIRSGFRKEIFFTLHGIRPFNLSFRDGGSSPLKGDGGLSLLVEHLKVQFTYWVGGLMVEPACASLTVEPACASSPLSVEPAYASLTVEPAYASLTVEPACASWTVECANAPSPIEMSE